MKTFEYLNTKEDKESLETIYTRIFKTAESGEFVNQHLVNASMNLKAAIVELDRAIKSHEIEDRHEAADQNDILNQTLTALGLK